MIWAWRRERRITQCALGLYIGLLMGCAAREQCRPSPAMLSPADGWLVKMIRAYAASLATQYADPADPVLCIALIQMPRICLRRVYLGEVRALGTPWARGAPYDCDVIECDGVENWLRDCAKNTSSGRGEVPPHCVSRIHQSLDSIGIWESAVISQEPAYVMVWGEGSLAQRIATPLWGRLCVDPILDSMVRDWMCPEDALYPGWVHHLVSHLDSSRP